MTVIVAGNAGGGVVPPHVIFKGKTSRALINLDVHEAPEGTQFSVSESGWTKNVSLKKLIRTNVVFLKSLKLQGRPIYCLSFLCDRDLCSFGSPIMQFLPRIGDARPQVIILDGHKSHEALEVIKAARANGIIIVKLPQHTNHWLQPLDR